MPGEADMSHAIDCDTIDYDSTDHDSTDHDTTDYEVSQAIRRPPPMFCTSKDPPSVLYS